MTLKSNLTLILNTLDYSNVLCLFQDKITPQVKLRSYISGPVSDYTDLNLPAFNKMEMLLSVFYFQNNIILDIINPLRLIPPSQQHGKKWADFMKIDLKELMDVDFVVMLPDWQNSDGAIWEFLNAKILNIPVFDAQLNLLILPPSDIEKLFLKTMVKMSQNDTALIQFINNSKINRKIVE